MNSHQTEHQSNEYLPSSSSPSPSPSPSPPPPPAPPPFSFRSTFTHLPPLTVFLSVLLGGAIGASLRFAFTLATASYQSPLSSSTPPTLRKSFPLSTFISNLLGCLLIPFFSSFTSSSPHLRALLVTGFTGSLTTMSSFVLDCVDLWQDERTTVEGVKDDTGGRGWVGVVYAVTTLGGGMAMVWIGREGVRTWEGWRGGKKMGRKGGEGEGEREEVRDVEAGGSVDAGQIEMMNGQTNGRIPTPNPT